MHTRINHMHVSNRNPQTETIRTDFELRIAQL